MEITIRIPKMTTILRSWKWGLLALLAVAFTLTLAQSPTPTTEAETTAAEMSFNVKSGGICDDPAKPTKCSVPTGSTFTLSVSVNSLPSTGGYIAMQTWIVYGNNLTYKKNPDPCAEIVWPDNAALGCIRLQGDDDGDTTNDRVYHGDSTGNISPLPVSTFVGNVVEIELNCTADPSSNSVSLVPLGVAPAASFGAGFLGPGEPGAQVPAKSSPLLINCVVPSQINITKQDSVLLVLLPDSCYDVHDSTNTTLHFQVCDNDFQAGFPQANATVCIPDGVCNDEDALGGLIRVTVAVGQYSVSESKPPPGYNPDPNKQACNAIAGSKCGLLFFNESETSQVNITNLGQYALPKTCFDVRDDLQNPLFVVCDNDFQGPPDSDPVCIPDGVCDDEDAAEGLIRVTVGKGDYSVEVVKIPFRHTADTSKQACNAVGGSKCELTFVNAPNTTPWFPWDVNGDGTVDLFNDIVEVIQHIFQTKP